VRLVVGRGRTYLECQEQQECFDTVEATIDIVAHEEVVCFGAVAANTEELLQVVELPMDITTDLQIHHHSNNSHPRQYS
jgi:hypothetical protein